MREERVLHILERVAARTASGDAIGAALCASATEMIEISGAALMLVPSGSAPRTVGICGDLMAVLEEVQAGLGEGPCIDAYELGEPVSEPDLAGSPAERWIGFTPQAVAAGAGAVHGYPLRIGRARIGALNLCATGPGALDDRQHSDALAIAHLATHVVLAVQAGAPPDTLAAELEDVGSHQVVVHQATGMVAAQLAAPVGDALARLRAQAFVTDRPISAVAAEVVARRLRFEP